MQIQIGKVLVEGDAHRSGFDFSLALPFTHPIHEYRIHRAFFAVWFARRCDAGVMVGRWEWRRSFAKRVAS